MDEMNENQTMDDQEAAASGPTGDEGESATPGVGDDDSATDTDTDSDAAA